MNILVILPGFIPSTIIGILRPLSQLEAKGEIHLRLRLSHFTFRLDKDTSWCDAAVFCRNCEVRDLKALYELKRKGKKIVYETDDNFLEIPLTTEVGLHHRAFQRLHVFRRFFSLSDVTRVYSTRLDELASSHGANTQRIKSYFDADIISQLPRPQRGGKIKIVYPTGRIDDKYLEDILFTSVRIILERYQGSVEFHLWRESCPTQLIGLANVVLNRPLRGYDEFIRKFYSLGYDIGLAPGIDTPFFRSKTNNKYREFGGCGIAGVYSDFPPYSDSVINEETGLLTSSAVDCWVSSIERLINDPPLRERIAKKALADVTINYSFESSIDSWRQCFQLVEKKAIVNPQNKWVYGFKGPRFSLLFCSFHRICNDQRQTYLDICYSFLYKSKIRSIKKHADLIKIRSLQESGVVFFFVNHIDDLAVILSPQTLLSSSIIDLTRFDGNIEKVITALSVKAGLYPISIILPEGYQSKNTQIDFSLFYKVSEVNLSEDYETQYLSLSGYPANYFDLIEQHSSFAIENGGNMKLIYVVISSFMYRIYNSIFTRIGTLLAYIKFVLGVRNF